MLDWLFAQKNERSEAAVTLEKDSSVTREDLARVLVQRLNLEEVRGTSIYADTADSSYDLAIRQASTAGVMQGVGSERFAPGLAVTRAQLAVMADRVLGSEDKAGKAAASAYGDVPTSYWAAQAIARVTSEEIMQGTSTSAFEPNRLVTGAEVEAVLEKLAAANP